MPPGAVCIDPPIYLWGFLFGIRDIIVIFCENIYPHPAVSSLEKHIKCFTLLILTTHELDYSRIVTKQHSQEYGYMYILLTTEQVCMSLQLLPLEDHQFIRYVLDILLVANRQYDWYKLIRLYNIKNTTSLNVAKTAVVRGVQMIILWEGLKPISNMPYVAFTLTSFISREGRFQSGRSVREVTFRITIHTAL